MDPTIGYTQNKAYGPVTVVEIEQQLPVKDHIIWSIFNFSYLNCCCLGLVAFLYSIKARDQKVVRNLNQAKHYGRLSRNFNIAATVLSLIVIAIMLYFYSILLIQMITSNINRQNTYGPD
ncbi:dispanin subfamily A member 2b [Amia ocellicauda]|uniref:dispanin subfamily A member 2b n=1 Tax=Amia ocellicauda TaxID=2972642 RepID=UPI003464698C